MRDPGQVRRRETAGDRQGLPDGAFLQVHGGAQPADEGRRGEVEAGLAQPVAQRVPGEIHRDEPDVFRYRRDAALPFLRRRMVDFEYPNLSRQPGPAGEGIQAGAEHDVLADTAPDAVGQAVAAAYGVSDEHLAKVASERRSKVTFDIEPVGEMVKLTVIHDDFDPGSAVLPGISEGWPRILSDLKTLLETGETLVPA